MYFDGIFSNLIKGNRKMRKIIILIIGMIICLNGLSAQNDKVQIHKLCIPYYSIMLESIMKLKKEHNVSEFLIC